MPETQKIDLRLGSVLLFYALILVVPCGFIGYYAAADQVGSFAASLHALLTDSLYAGVLLNTIYISLLVTVSTLLIAYPLVYLLAHAPAKWKRILLLLITSSMWINVLVRSFSWIVLLAKGSPLSKALVFLHLMGEGDSLAFSRFAVVAGMTNILLPIMIFCINSAVPGNIHELKKVSRSLRATDAFYFIKVFLPESRRGALAGMLLVFLLSLGYYITPALLGGGHRDTMMISLLIEQQINQLGNWQMGALLSIFLTAGIMLVLSAGLLPRLVRQYLSGILTNQSHVK
jgi:putative spermidine/putrescine transport system permease protein